MINLTITVPPGGIMALEIPPIPRQHSGVSIQATFIDKYGTNIQTYRSASPFETKNNYALRVLTELEDGALKVGCCYVTTSHQ